MNIRINRTVQKAGLIASAICLLCMDVNAQPFAYVTNVSGNNVSVVDLSNNTVIDHISVPGSPTGVVVSANGALAYVAAQGNGTVSVIDGASRTVVAKIDIGAPGTQLALNPAESQLYIAVPTQDRVVVVDTGSRSVVGNIQVGTRPSAVAFNAAGTRAYVANLLSGEVAIIDTASLAVIQKFSAAAGATSVAVGGNTVFIANQYAGTVTAHSGDGGLIGTVSGFAFPNDLALTPDGRKLLVSNGNGGSVSIVDTSSLSIVKTVPTGSLPTAVAVSANGVYAFVTNQYSFSLSVIDIASGTVAASISKVGVYPIGVAVAGFTPGAPSTPAAPCAYSLSAASASFGPPAGNSSVNVSTSQGCPWTAGANAGWVHVTSAATGNGPAALTFSVDPNAGTDARTAVLTIAGNPFTILQAGLACSFTLSSSSASFPAAGGSGSVSIGTLAGCSWNALSDSSWLSVSSGSGLGPAALTFTAAPNPNVSPRSAVLTLGGQQFTAMQAGVAFSPIRVNCGGPSFTDGQGRLWAGDEGRNRSTTTAPILGTDTPGLYQTESWGDNLQYQFTAPNGTYTVKLRFAETYGALAGSRVFHIYVNGQMVEANLDIAAVAGRNTALDKAYQVNVANGQISIRLETSIGMPKVNGIEIQ